MQRGLGGTVFAPTEEPQAGRARELTLGPGMLLGLACGLLALCGLCFFFGYKVGHRAESASAVALPAAGTPATAAPSASPQSPQPSQTSPSSQTPQSKPSAGQSGAQPQQPTATPDQPTTSRAH